MLRKIIPVTLTVMLIGIIQLLFWSWYFHYFHYLYTKVKWNWVVKDEFAKLNNGVLPQDSFIIWEMEVPGVTLHLSGGFKDLSPISRMNMVDCIFLDGTGVKNLEFTKGMTNLTWLDISETNLLFDSLSGVENLKKLKSLSVWDASKVRSLKPLENLSLRSLDLRNLSLSDIAPLASMRIERLILNGSKNIVDISPIGKIRGLIMLSLENTGVKDLTPLTNSEIKNLYLDDTFVTSLLPLETMKKLRGLTINNTPAAALPAPPAVKVILGKSKKGNK